MERRTGWMLAIGLAALALVASEAAAWGGPGGRGPGRRGGGHPGAFCMGPGGGPHALERMAARLDLTDEQKAEIEKIWSADEEKLVSLKKEMMRARHDLRGEMMMDNPDASKVRKLAEKIGGIRTNIQIARLENQMMLRKILTEEQRDRLLLAPHGRGGGWCQMGFGDDDDRPGAGERPFRRFEGRGRRAWQEDDR
ncbi:MAG: Spy/CpxP family protein refolding chaperone [Candidatus Eisenbacteria bacterium]